MTSFDNEYIVVAIGLQQEKMIWCLVYITIQMGSFIRVNGLVWCPK